MESIINADEEEKGNCELTKSRQWVEIFFKFNFALHLKKN